VRIELVGAAHANAATYIFASGALVVILGGLGLTLIELIRVLTRRAESARVARGELRPGLFNSIHENLELPTNRNRLRVMWIVVGGCGVIALIALLVNRA
jgi:hypothetical protein